MTVTSQALLLLALFFLGTTVRKMMAQDCGGNYTSSDGILLSPNYPNVYNSFCQCTYTISLSTISTILLIFDTFELEPTRGDNVTISCESNSSFVQRTYYGNIIATPISITWCRSAQLFFQTDANNTFSAKGFKIRYQVSTIGCGNTVRNYYTEQSEFGNILSPNYPQSYNNNENCTYLMWTAQSSSFTLNFQSFNLESSDCQYDWVQIWCDDTGYKLPKYCGSTVPAPVSINNCKQVLVWFHTNEANVFGGFNLQYSVTPYDYDQFNYAGLSGTITSPNYPRSYTNTIRSYHVYPVGSVTFTFLAFDLEPFVNYSYRAYVRVDCTDPMSNGRHGPFRGNNLPPPITFESCSLAEVHYYSNNVPAAGTGFSVQYQVNPIVANGAITTKPVNTAAYVGSQVQLNCTSSITGYLPSWTMSKDGTDANTTFIASFCFINSVYYTGRSQYSVVSGGPGVCNLVIANATLAEAGVYTCIDASLASYSSVVSVIEVLPNIIDQEPEVVKGDVLSFQYSVKFASSVAPAATPPLVISWIANEKTVASSIINQPDTVISSHIVTAQPEVPSYGFKVSFSSPVNNSDYATNTPTFTYQGNTTSVNVLFSSPTTIVATSTTYPVTVSSPTTTVAASTYPVSSPATTVATSAYSVFLCTITVATSSHPGVGVIVLSLLLGICVIGYMVLGFYYIMQRVRGKSNLPQNARQHSAENRGFEDTIPANLYADARPKVVGQPVYDNIPIPSLQSGSSKKPAGNEARLYESLTNASHEPVVYDSLQRLPE